MRFGLGARVSNTRPRILPDLTGPAHILQRRDREAYVHYIGTDKRLDEWVAKERCIVSTSNPPSYRANFDPNFHSHPAGPSTTNRQPQFGVFSLATGKSSVLAGPGLLVGPGVAGLTSTTSTAGDAQDMAIEENVSTSKNTTGMKRKRGRPPRNAQQQQEHQNRGNQNASASTAPAQEPPPEQEVQTPIPKDMVMTEEEYDVHHHKQITANRNFDYVYFGEWQVKTWCVSY